MNAFDMKAAFPEAIENIGKENNNIVVVVGDIGHFALQGFAKNNPNRFYNLGILEPTLVSTCAGLSAEGFIPIGHTIAPFITERSLEQIKLDFCYQELPGNIISVGSAFDYSTLGCTHHSYCDLGIVSSYPNTEVCYPASPEELKKLTLSNFDSKFLTYYRMARHPHGVHFENIEFGKNIKVKEGNDITLIASGPQLKTILKASEELKKHSISAEIIYCHTLKPFDKQSVIESVTKTKNIIAVEEHVKFGSLLSNVLDSIINVSDIRYDYHCLPDKFIRKYGKYEEISNALGFTAENIYKKAIKLLN